MQCSFGMCPGPDVLPPVNSELSFPLETAPNTLTINSVGALVAVGGRKGMKYMQSCTCIQGTMCLPCLLS